VPGGSIRAGGPTDSDFAFAGELDGPVPDFSAHLEPASPQPSWGPFSKAAAAGGHRPYASTASSRGRPLPLNTSTKVVVARYVSALLQAGIVEHAPRGAFVSYPFLIPKGDGTARLIIDYSHITNSNSLRPVELHLPPLAVVLRSVEAKRGNLVNLL